MEFALEAAEVGRTLVDVDGDFHVKQTDRQEAAAFITRQQ